MTMATPWVRDIASRRSLGELLNELTDGGAELVRDEIRLARAETVESLLTLRRGAVLLGIGIAFALCAAAAAVACLIMVVSQYLVGDRMWLAALIVAVALGVIGWLCVWRGGQSFTGSKLAPHETTTSIKETAAWLKHPARSAAR
jgi:uncharacterized membrane protein YqjE